MNKNKKVKLEPTLDAFYRAIRTYDRDTVSALMQYVILFLRFPAIADAAQCLTH